MKSIVESLRRSPQVIFVALAFISLGLILGCERIWKYDGGMCSTIITPTVFVGFSFGIVAAAYFWKKKQKGKALEKKNESIDK